MADRIHIPDFITQSMHAAVECAGAGRPGCYLLNGLLDKGRP